jgi:hypothetical protein
VFGLFVIVAVPLSIIALIIFLLVVILITPVILFILFWMVFFVYLVILVIIVGVMFIPIVIILAGLLLSIAFGIFFLASAILFATPAIGLLIVFFAFFYWIVLFPLGLAGGIILLFSNFTCLMMSGDEKRACEDAKNEDISGFF